MSDEEWGFAGIYRMEEEPKGQVQELEDVRGEDWRNILVLGRATPDGVYPETLALVGRARYLADELGCRVEVLLMGEDLDAATEVLKKYPIDTVYRVAAPDYAPIDLTSRILEAVVKKRRPELVLVFQSRTGDAVTAYTANRLGVGFVLGAVALELDTLERRAVVDHHATNEGFQIRTELLQVPQFVSVQRGLFRTPMEDPYANVRVYDLDVDPGPGAPVEVLERRPPAQRTLADAPRVVVAGARVRNQADVDAARALAKALDAVFGVTRSLVERGLGDATEMVAQHDTHVRPRLLVTVGVRGSLEFLEAIEGRPLLCAVGSDPDDPVCRRAAYLVPGPVDKAVASVLDALGASD